MLMATKKAFPTESVWATLSDKETAISRYSGMAIAMVSSMDAVNATSTQMETVSSTYSRRAMA